MNIERASPLSLGRSTLRRGFDTVERALASIQGLSEDERQALITLVKIGRGHIARARTGSERALTILADRAFTWPEFDRWEAFFARRDAFPVRWEGLQAAPELSTSRSAQVAYQLRKLELLVEWLEGLAHGAAALGHYARQGVRARIVRQGDGRKCPACEPWDGHEVKHRTDMVPPIHPGCRCVLIATTSAGRA
jgi:hypothetical protein